MAKKIEVKEETKVVVHATPSALPAVTGASERVTSALAEVEDNLKAVENYRLPRAKITQEGFLLSDDEEPATELEGVLIHAKKTNVYYANPYIPGELEPPTCYSLDGITPDKSVEKPIHKTCSGCPMAEFGTNAMKSGKACRNLKPLFMLCKTDDGFSIMPRQITITPTSLKAANTYLMNLTERGISYRKIMTKMIAAKENKNDTYATLTFVRGEKLSAQDLADVEILRKQWMPIMDSQMVDQREVDAGQATTVQDTNAGY